MKHITIVIPVYNEEKTITDTLGEIINCAKEQTQVKISLLLVDDGSSDATATLIRLLCEMHSSLSLLCLNRNFGKEAAICAGLWQARKSDAVIVMDSDLQHPPSLFPELIELWLHQGKEVVEACKKSRGEESLLRKTIANGYYSLFDFCTGLQIKNQSDYKLLDQKVVDFYCNLPEKERFFRGLVNWMHFETAQVYFDVPHIANNTTSWGRWKLAQFAISSITSFTSFPLQVVTLFGLITFVVSIIIGSIALYDKISGNAVDGFTTVILLLLFIGSILMFSLGLIGIYLAKIYDEIKARPAFILNKKKSYLQEED